MSVEKQRLYLLPIWVCAAGIAFVVGLMASVVFVLDTCEECRKYPQYLSVFYLICGCFLMFMILSLGIFSGEYHRARTGISEAEHTRERQLEMVDKLSAASRHVQDLAYQMVEVSLPRSEVFRPWLLRHVAKDGKGKISCTYHDSEHGKPVIMVYITERDELDFHIVFGPYTPEEEAQRPESGA